MVSSMPTPAEAGEWSDILERFGEVLDLTLSLASRSGQEVGDVACVGAWQFELRHRRAHDPGSVSDAEGSGCSEIERASESTVDRVRDADVGLDELSLSISSLGRREGGGSPVLDGFLTQPADAGSRPPCQSLRRR